MKICVAVLGLFLKFLGTDAFIIPDELPSILSVIYSNIPTLKKGTDSRLGWGFRLGNRADFQVLVELGPQTNTQPLANQGDTGNSKRNTLENLANTLYAQRQREKQEKELEKQQEVTKPSQDTEAAKWLNTWSKDMRNEEENESVKNLIQTLSKAKPGLAEGEIDAKSVIPDDESVEHVKHVYPKTSPTTQKTTTSTDGALDDVDLE